VLSRWHTHYHAEVEIIVHAILHALAITGSMEGHAAMDMSVKREGSFARRLFSREGYTSVSHVFVMEWAAIARDLVIGLLIAGAVAAPLFRFVRTGGRMMLRMMGGAPDTRHRG
jgi:uncharacterized membrane protein YraQ (UPF0718 family)